MEKKDILKKIILEAQNLKFNFIQRQLNLPLDIHKIITVYGPRRCGKTYLFYQTIKQLQDKKIPPDRIIYINFEDERILPFYKEDWENLLDAYFELYPDNIDKEIYVFLDEIQIASYWEKFVRRLSEKENFYIFLTGSSSKLLSKEIVTTLRGRTLSYFLMPFSFREVLQFHNIKIEKNFEYSLVRHKIKKIFEEYLKFGGFPEILNKDEFLKIQILQSYFDLIFYKDIVERYKIRNFSLLKNLMRYLLSCFSSLFSYRSYYNFLKSTGQKIGKATLFEYLYFLEEINFVKFVPLFSFSLKKQMINPKKIYSIDTGLVTAIAWQFTENRGRYLENLAFLELLRTNKEIYYFKDRKENEIDFLITEKSQPKKIIQVTQILKNQKDREKEIKLVLDFAKELKVKECIILTEDQKEEIKVGKLKIRLIPLWVWLIEQNK